MRSPAPGSADVRPRRGGPRRWSGVVLFCRPRGRAAAGWGSTASQPRLGGRVVVGVAILPGQHAPGAEGGEAVVELASAAAEILVVAVAQREDGIPQLLQAREAITRSIRSMNPAALSGGSPSPPGARDDEHDWIPWAVHRHRTLPGRGGGASRPPALFPPLFLTFLARAFGVAGLAAEEHQHRRAWRRGQGRGGESWPSKVRRVGGWRPKTAPPGKPLSHWRCSSLKGALSGNEGDAPQGVCYP